jgi:hypothetical protein
MTTTDLCQEVGNPKNFYFIYPAVSNTNGYLDINEAVKQDAGQTSVCMIYLTHMIGKARAVAMMVDKKTLSKHLSVLKLLNFDNQGFDVVALKFSDFPIMGDDTGSFLSKHSASFVLGSLAIALFLGHKFQSTRWLTDLLFFVGVPFIAIKSTVDAMQKEIRNYSDRALELESKQLGFSVHKWQEQAQASPPERPVVAGKLRHVAHSRQSAKARNARRKVEAEFSRLRAQSQEAAVAGGVDPRIYRTERERLRKMEESSSRSKSQRKSAHAGTARSR